MIFAPSADNTDIYGCMAKALAERGHSPLDLGTGLE